MDLNRIVRELNVPSPPEVLVGLVTGDDAGVYKIGPDLNLVLTADFIPPPCDDPFLFGQIAAANSLSDVYAMGGTPKVALNLCCFPPKGIPKETLTTILRGGLETMTEAGVALVGGHTVRDDQLKYGLSVTGLVRDRHIRTNTGARPGDLLILTKPVGTGIVVEGVRGGKISEADVRPVFERMAELNKAAAETMNRFDDVHAATDITGFGLGGHGWEMASGSKVGLRFEFARVPRWPVAEDLAGRGVRSAIRLSDNRDDEEKIVFDPSLTPEQQMFFLDPQTSGGLLIAVAADQAETLRVQLVEAGIADAAICAEVFAAEHPHLEIRP